MTDQELIHRIALSILKGIGPVNARNLVAYCGGVDPLFTDKKVRKTLQEKVPGIGPVPTIAMLLPITYALPPVSAQARTGRIGRSRLQAPQ